MTATGSAIGEQVRAEAMSRMERRIEAYRLTTRHPLERSAPGAILVAPERENDTRPFASSREPCTKCGARGDFGCDHQRPWSPIAGTEHA